jgi:hypothetical protein
MRKLKLQTQVTIDCFMAGPNGELDWMTWDWDEDLRKLERSVAFSCGIALLKYVK